MSLTCETRRAGSATGLGNAVCLAANNPQLNLQKQSSQEANGAFRQFQEVRVSAADLFPARPRLRLVERGPPRPRRLEVTIGIRDRREPFGRAGPFRLLGRDLDELIAIVERMEARR
jgi:hypothetical protein